jgi:hypothetical protein
MVAVVAVRALRLTIRVVAQVWAVRVVELRELLVMLVGLVCPFRGALGATVRQTVVQVVVAVHLRLGRTVPAIRVGMVGPGWLQQSLVPLSREPVVAVVVV